MQGLGIWEAVPAGAPVSWRLPVSVWVVRAVSGPVKNIRVVRTRETRLRPMDSQTVPSRAGRLQRG